MPSAIRRLVPLESENRWSDLLAVLIETDPAAAAQVFGLGGVTGRTVTVAREVPAAGGADRVDILLHVDGVLTAVVEAKVLSGLGTRQLDRYSISYPDADSYLVISPERLPIHPGATHPWRAVSWESVLERFAQSSDAWVAETATAWLSHLATDLPEVSPDLRWNALRPGENFALAMRARISWVYRQLHPPPSVTTDIMQSSGSKAWVVRLYTPGALPDYVVAAEAEERTARGWPTVASADGRDRLTGPSLWIGLRQQNVTTSAGFDWDYLNTLWQLMKAARSDWMMTRPAVVAPHDRENWKKIGSPVGLGFGFGEREAAKRGACMFGARFQLPRDVRLGDVVTELQAAAELLQVMSDPGVYTGGLAPA